MKIRFLKEKMLLRDMRHGVGYRLSVIVYQIISFVVKITKSCCDPLKQD